MISRQSIQQQKRDNSNTYDAVITLGICKIYLAIFLHFLHIFLYMCVQCFLSLCLIRKLYVMYEIYF